MRAILVGLAIMAPVFALIEARAVPEPSFGAIAAGAHVVPLGPTGFMSVTGANSVAVIDMAKLNVVSQLKAGTQPQGLIIL